MKTEKSRKSLIASLQAKILNASILFGNLSEIKDQDNLNLNVYLRNVKDKTSKLLSYPNVQFAIEIDSIVVNSKVALNLSYITFELISNSLKHAFSETNNATITIKIKLRRGRIWFIYGDNGTPRRDGINLKSKKSIGMWLLSHFIQELHANHRIFYSSGTAYFISFREKL